MPLLLASLLLLSLSSAASRRFSIEHSLDGGASFSQRSSFQSEAGEVSWSGEAGVSVGEVDAFKSLLEREGKYVIRIREAGNHSEAVLASMPACELQKSNFKEDLALHMDRDGKLVGVHWTSPVIALPRACNPRKIPSDKPLVFHSKLRVAEPATASIIPVQATGPRPPALANVKMDVEDVSEGAKPEANQSFLRKYWYIVLPMVIFTLFGGGEPPAEGTAASTAGASGAATTATAAK